MLRPKGRSPELEVHMNNVFQNNETHVVVMDGLTELVRGNDARLVATLAPLVRDEDVDLDMNKVHRIDAAGIAALISLYGCARDSGHAFHVRNVSTRVEEILSLVGLDHILVTSTTVLPNCRGCEQPAA
jgi:anti-anti-sigma factor